MNRSIERWKASCPTALAAGQSEAARTCAFEDARHDILELHDQNKRLAQILEMVAYPGRGTKEESMSLQDFADMIQKTYTLEQLQEASA
jgi:hypothetical protein